jgi:hypothetical protein
VCCVRPAKAISLFAVLSIILTALATFASLSIELDCRINSTHAVVEAGEMADSSTASAVKPSPSNYGSGLNWPSDLCQQEGKAVHLHDGVHSHALPNDPSSVIDSGSLTFLPLSPEVRLSDDTVYSLIKPPRTST